MSYKIVVDSSSNLKNDYLKDQDIGFEVVPLTIRVDDEIFVDNDNIDVDKMLTSMHKSKKKSTSACPSPYDFLKTFEGYDNIFIITISSKLSGCYNSAINAGQQAQNEGKKVYVIDSKATAGSMILLVDEVYRLIKENYSFEEIKTKIEEYQKSINLLFVLSKYDNLVKNGRMSRFVAIIATSLAIKPLCIADNGEIKVQEKIRTFKGVLKRLVFNIGTLCKETKNKICYICHTKNLEDSLFLKSLIEKNYSFKDIRIVENRGLTAFYSLEKGIIVSF